jgi:hypothetical protein
MQRKKKRDQLNKQHFQEKVERDLSSADEKRKAKQGLKIEKLRKHIEKVEVVCKEQAVKRKESSESLKQQLEKKHELAFEKREEQLEQVKSIAHMSAEKKKVHSSMPGENIQINEIKK